MNEESAALIIQRQWREKVRRFSSQKADNTDEELTETNIKEIIPEPKIRIELLLSNEHINEYDCSTMESFENTPEEYRIDYGHQSSTGKIDYYFFDVRTLALAFGKFNNFINPYTNLKFSEEFIWFVHSRVIFLIERNMWDTSIFNEGYEELSDEDKMKLRMTDMVQTINECGFYWKQEWLLKLSRKSIRRIICEFNKFVLERLPLSRSERKELTGDRYFYFSETFHIDRILKLTGNTRKETKMILRKELCDLIEFLLSNTKDKQKLTLYFGYFITAFVSIYQAEDIMETYGYNAQDFGTPDRWYDNEPNSDGEDYRKIEIETEIREKRKRKKIRQQNNMDPDWEDNLEGFEDMISTLEYTTQPQLTVLIKQSNHIHLNLGVPEDNDKIEHDSDDEDVPESEVEFEHEYENEDDEEEPQPTRDTEEDEDIEKSTSEENSEEHQNVRERNALTVREVLDIVTEAIDNNEDPQTAINRAMELLAM